MILWFIDRFGLPGEYHRIWVRLLRDTHIETKGVLTVSLHRMLGRTLLTKHGTRKAPTWIPEEGPKITAVIDELIQKHKPKAVVLAAPEALACVGIHPEHATLHNLRGGVYWRSGVPHIVMLPMSAWKSMVTQKEIGAANYGFDSKDSFVEGRQDRAIHQQDGNGSTELSRQHGDEPNAGTGINGRSQSPAIIFNRQGGGNGGGSVGRNRLGSSPEQLRQAGSRTRSADDESETDRGIRDGFVPGADDGGSGGDGADRDARASDGFGNGPGRGQGADGSGTDDSGDDEHQRVDGGDDDLPDTAEGPQDSSDSDDGSDVADEDESDREAGEVDQFFYEPVLSPVGRFVLTADTQKLARILRDGPLAAGPKHPITLDWR